MIRDSRRLLAFDIGEHTAYALVEEIANVDPNDRREYSVTHHGSISLAKATMGQRLNKLLNETARVLVGVGKVDLVAVELADRNWHQNTTPASMRALIAYASIIEMAVVYAGLQLPVYFVDPNTWHYQICGPQDLGTDYKELAIAQARLRADFRTDDDHEADAVCIGIHQLRQLRYGAKKQVNKSVNKKTITVGRRQPWQKIVRTAAGRR